MIPITRDVNFYDVMNNYGHRGPDQEHDENRRMGHKEFTEGFRTIRRGTAYLGFNLRLHNQNCPDSKISIVDVAQAIVDDRKDKRIEVAAAVNCRQYIQFMMKCFNEYRSRHTRLSFQRPYGQMMTEAFRNLHDFFPEIPDELRVFGYCACGAESGNQRDIENKATYISDLNQFLAERHLSTAELCRSKMASKQDLHRSVTKGYQFQNGRTCSTASRNQEPMEEMELIGTKNYERKSVENNEEKWIRLNMTFRCGSVGNLKRRRQIQPKGAKPMLHQVLYHRGNRTIHGRSGMHLQAHTTRRRETVPCHHSKRRDPIPEDRRPCLKRRRNRLLLSKKKNGIPRRRHRGSCPSKCLEDFGRDYDGHNIKFMLWSEDRHLYAPAPIAGPRAKIPGRQWRLYLRRVAYHVEVTMGGSVDVRFNLQPVTDQYLKTKMDEDDPFWTKLYAKLLKEFESKRCHQYPNAKAMLMLMKVIDPPEDAKQAIKNLHSKVGCFMMIWVDR